MKNKDIKPRNKNNQPHGYWERYWENGNLYYKGTYVNGKRHGYWEEYYVNGEQHGYWEEAYLNRFNYYI